MNAKDRIGVTKIPLGLMPVAALVHCCLALFDGVLKYTKANWRKEKISASIYYDAALRHIYKYIEGQENDADSGVHHLGHAMACLAILLDARETDNLIDDRPFKGSPELVDAAKEEVTRLLNLRDARLQVIGEPPVELKDVTKEISDVLKEWQDIPQSDPADDCDWDAYHKSTEGLAKQSKEKFLSDAAKCIANGSLAGEIIHGHLVEYTTDDRGFIDGEPLRGTDFTSRVARYRRGYDNADEEIADLSRRIKDHAVNSCIENGRL